MQALAVPPPTP